MTDFIAEAIAEQAASRPIVETKPEAPVETPTEPQEQPVEQPQEQTEDNQEKKPEKPQREEWPRSARDKVSRMGKKLTRAEFERDQLRSELESFKAKAPAPAEQTNYGLKEPNQDDYKTYDEFLMAKIDYRDQLKEAKQAEKSASQQPTAKPPSESEIRFATDAAKFEAETSDAPAVFEANGKTIKKLWDDPASREAILETDESFKGLYHLAKSGELEDLVGLSPYRIAVELSRAANTATAAPQSKAPPPMTPAKGSATGSKPTSQWSPEEAHKFLTKDR